MIELIINARVRDIGEFNVRRLLPYATHRMVGPFIFFDQMGPVELAAGHGMDVRPHPHVHLATVTYLFKGKIRHRDSLGSDQLIEPGAINWMTAGRGIVHSERSPDDLRSKGAELSGIQCWVALPEEFEDVDPSFHHHPKEEFSEFSEGDVRLKLLLGRAFGRVSPVKVHSDLFYLEAKMPENSRLKFDVEGREAAGYLLTGRLRIDGQQIEPGSMVVFNQNPEIHALSEAHIMFLGGPALPRRHIYWNFVASSAERIEAAKQAWRNGPAEGRFPKIPGDDQDYIPLPGDAP